MPTFIIQGRYSREAIQGMIAKPEDRSVAVAKLAESVGGRLVSYYVTFGSNDFLCIIEAPDEHAILAALAVVGGGPGVSDLTTTIAIPAGQAMKDFDRAKAVAAGFKAAGAG